jgi:hypothetical protein
MSNAAQSLGRIVGPHLGGIAFYIKIGYQKYFGAIVMDIGFVGSLFTLIGSKVKFVEAKSMNRFAHEGI